MMDFLQPPPPVSAFNVPPPSVQQSPSPTQHRHFHGGFAGKTSHFRSYNNFRGQGAMSQDDFDGKRLRKSVMRKTVDYNSSIVRALEVCKLSTIEKCVIEDVCICIFFVESYVATRFS